MSTATTTALPHEVIWALTNAMVPSRALQVAAELGIADQVADEPVPVTELAARCGLQPDALDRVLRMLAANGVFETDATGCRHTDASRLLRSDHPMSMRAFARLMGQPVCWTSMGALAHSLRSGAPAVQLLEPGGFFAYLQSHPQEAQVFGEAMAAKAHADIAAVLGAYDFGPFTTIADIGGGRGHLLQAVLEAAPRARGILFDLPDVVAGSGAGSDRLRLQGGDFFADALPAADAYLLMEVIHDWPDPQASAILQAIRRAAAPGATVLIMEDVLPEASADARSHTLDLIMLTVTGGRERTAAQLGELLSGAGFRLTTVVQTGGPMRIVEAVAV